MPPTASSSIDPFMVVVLIATPIVGVAFVLVWRWQTNKWARAEREQLRHSDDYVDDYPGDHSGEPEKQGIRRVVVRDDNSQGPA